MIIDDAQLADASWRKSSRSGPNGGQCVEVAHLHGAVGVRDSKDPAGGHLLVSADTWGAFAALVRGGSLDHR